jgi:hypothetical protein
MAYKTLSEMKKSRSNSTDFLKKVLDNANPSKKQYENDDETFWYPDLDKTGNGEAIIRFLPAPPDEELPFIRLFTRGFKGPTGSWYIENCRSTINENDPVGEYCTQLWNTGIEADKASARVMKRKLTFISNVYIVRDKLNPQNEGKVFRYRFGAKIFEKINSSANPSFEDDQAIDPFNLWDGANFRLRIKMKDGYRNYDDSKFDSPSPLFNDDDKIDEIWKQSHSLATFVTPDKFKSYDELKARMNRVLAFDSNVLVNKTASPVAEKTQSAKSNPVMDDDDDEDVDLDRFNELMKEDVD